MAAISFCIHYPENVVWEEESQAPNVRLSEGGRSHITSASCALRTALALVTSSIAQLFREGVEAVTARTRDVLAAT